MSEQRITGKIEQPDVLTGQVPVGSWKDEAPAFPETDEDEALFPPCENHREVQHRDAKPPWCDSCGWNRGRPAIAPVKYSEPRR